MKKLKKLEEEQIIEPITLSNSFGKYEVISTTYYEEYAKCTILIFNNQTGKIQVKKFNLK